MKYNGAREHRCQEIAQIGAAAAPGATSPAEEAWALLRSLLFAERRRFWAAAAEFDLHPAQAGALMQLDEQRGPADARDRLPSRL